MWCLSEVLRLYGFAMVCVNGCCHAWCTTFPMCIILNCYFCNMKNIDYQKLVVIHQRYVYVYFCCDYLSMWSQYVVKISDLLDRL